MIEQFSIDGEFFSSLTGEFFCGIRNVSDWHVLLGMRF